MNIERTLSVLHREGILPDRTLHSAQFQGLTSCLLAAFSAAGAIPALSTEDTRLYAALAPLHDIGKRAIRMIESGACGAFDPAILVCFQKTIGHACHAVYA